ncbi:Myb-like DNA-binding domain protein [Aspergillus fijiensis CBS 313.89]|uniref:Myb-like DNA-binding domain protein n=1 Tax=Aspergillus fijiensis CBS 313.89 TaxID=1448319 RepID=A0A8G1RQE0_9EURO|nr:uncharacterized protein BO72DRAFT_134360 [Aspergillus fijiensis CBS 313.89]RAK76418.1 hypothetical protein BO72DRAFT_134360 [Aspergillus fijiensis CBS 313.89]
MGRPNKRARFALPVEPEEDGGGDIDLHEARAQNDQRLKSIFEGIFEKYGRDFTDVGDEIDLQTGKIIVNNGHIQELEAEEEEAENDDPRSTTTKPDWRRLEQERSVASEEGILPKTRGHLSGEEEAAGLGNYEAPDDDRSRPVSPVLPSIQEPQAGLRIQHHPADGNEDAGKRDSNLPSHDDDDDDDGASVDSLLDNTLRIESILDQSTTTTTTKLVSEKAKPAAEATAQSHGNRRSEAVEELWRVPEINASFSTPTWNRSRPAASTVYRVRSQSPPGAGSLWSLPEKSRRAPRKSQAGATTKIKPQRKVTQSSPVVCDWSFAETPEGDESDDPLQEDYEPSPTPKRSIHVRGKTPVKEHYTPRQLNYQCSDCKQVFVRHGYITHFREIASRPFDGQHDRAEVTRRLDTLVKEPTPKSKSKTTTSITPNILTGSRANELVDDNSTPTKKRARNVIQPDEARLIITMRQVQGKKWNEILDCLPHTKLTSLIQWNRNHWSDRRANPPSLSKPWSEAERAVLGKFKEQQGLSWTTIREGLPGRPHAEIEFELLQLWAGTDTL